MDDTGAATVLILGGRSEIGIELARRLAPGATVILAARRADQLTEQVAVVLAAGATAVHTREFDADNLDSHAALVASVIADHGPIDTAVLAFGILGDQARAETDAAHAVAVVHTDYVAQVSLLTHLAAAMRVAGRGSLVVFSSIAGARVRRANYVYGSAKAGLDGFASGLADALHDFAQHAPDHEQQQNLRREQSFGFTSAARAVARSCSNGVTCGRMCFTSRNSGMANA